VVAGQAWSSFASDSSANRVRLITQSQFTDSRRFAVSSNRSLFQALRRWICGFGPMVAFGVGAGVL
jgi:hypothetical protein